MLAKLGDVNRQEWARAKVNGHFVLARLKCQEKKRLHCEKRWALVKLVTVKPYGDEAA